MPNQRKSPSSAERGVPIPLTSNPGSSTDKMSRVGKWLEKVPHGNALYDAFEPSAMTPDLHNDWLQWTKKNAMTWLRNLD